MVAADVDLFRRERLLKDSGYIIKNQFESYFMEKEAKIYIAGHRGMVGSAIQRKFQKEGFDNFITRTSDTLDLRNQQQVGDFFLDENPDYVCDPFMYF